MSPAKKTKSTLLTIMMSLMMGIKALLWNRATAKVVGVAAVGGTVFVGGYQTYRIAEMKIGIIAHDQGYRLERQPDGCFRLNIDGTLSSRCFDLDDPTQWRPTAEWIAQIGIDRFGKDSGCSYQTVSIIDSTYKFQNYNALSYHASGWNSPSIGCMLLRTDDQDYNRRTLDSFERDALPEIRDTILDMSQRPLQYILFHSDVALNGKQDPHEFRPMMKARGLWFDDRSEYIRYSHLPRSTDTPPAP